ncbi:MAG: hydrolase, HAD-superfamily, subfamily [Mucilaginibacter sp.]|jgi:D-glycero-D-manno-heptose 1,7-bisphosphate phosphatase|nr:hydrolase, HAD-superfamily, subfamily [Mucilaginibacter sp.]MDB5017239.1 hydrolase, HAD-superfamily, subfamily [Mucilaginibacter sp.]MDB5140126.1 hydrolase, HAD-superfamily, subfamily [Mucilaginibacter sp.]
MKKAVFLDKDGTLVVDVPYNVDPDKIVLSDHCLKGLKRLQEDGFLLILITNQSGIARGYFKEEDLIAVEKKIRELLGHEEIVLDGFYYCPHHPDGVINSLAIDCDCRKPEAGMLFRAAQEMGVNLNLSWMIGDILNDVEAGNRAGCKSILIDNGNETEWLLNERRKPLAKVKNIDEAAVYILEKHGKQVGGM